MAARRFTVVEIIVEVTRSGGESDFDDESEVDLSDVWDESDESENGRDSSNDEAEIEGNRGMFVFCLHCVSYFSVVWVSLSKQKEIYV